MPRVGSLEYVSPQYEQRLDELAERLMTDRFIRSMGSEAVEAVYVQDALLEVEG